MNPSKKRAKSTIGHLATALLCLTLISLAHPLYAAVTEATAPVAGGGTLRLQLFRDPGANRSYFFKVCTNPDCTRRPRNLRERVFPVQYLIDRFIGRGNWRNCVQDLSRQSQDADDLVVIPGAAILSLGAVVGLASISMPIRLSAAMLSPAVGLSALAGFGSGNFFASGVEMQRELTTALYIESFLFDREVQGEDGTRTPVLFSPEAVAIRSPEVEFGLGEAIRRRYAHITSSEVSEYRMTMFRLVKGRLLEDLASYQGISLYEDNDQARELVEINHFDETARQEILESNRSHRSHCRASSNE